VKIKFALVILLIGFVVTLLGAWLKITHISFGPFNGNIVVTFGTIIQGLGALLLIIMVLTSQKIKNFLKK